MKRKLLVSRMIFDLISMFSGQNLGKNDFLDNECELQIFDFSCADILTLNISYNVQSTKTARNRP